MSILVARFLLKTALFLARSTKLPLLLYSLVDLQFYYWDLAHCSLYNISYSSILRVLLQLSLHQLLVPLLTCIDTPCATRILRYTESFEDSR